MTFNDFARQKRRAAGLTQTKVADALGCAQEDVSRAETGEYAYWWRLDRLASLAALYDMKLSELIAEWENL